MSQHRPSFFTAAVFLVSLMCFGFSSCSNGNLFGKLNKSGDSSNTQALLSDAENALRDQDFSEALTLYERILARDPNNSEALYGAAAAAIRGSGLDVGTLISNVTSESSVAHVAGLGSFIAQARTSVHSSAVSPNSILSGIDLDRLDATLNFAICRLNKIVSGVTDGKIKPLDVDVMLNLGLLYAIRAALRPALNNLIDIQNVSGNYDVVVDASLTGGVCDGSTVISGFTSGSQQQEMLMTVAKDIVASYALFKRSVQVLHLTGNPVIVQVLNDIEEAATQVLDGSTGVPSQCVTLFNNAGITAGSFTNNVDVFNAPTGC